jgi:hypothetical protein
VISHAPARARRAEPSLLARVRHDQRLATLAARKVGRLRIPAQHADEQRDNDTEQRRSAVPWVGGVAELRASQAGAHPLHGSYPRRRPSPKATPVFLRDARAWKRGRSNADHPRHSPYHLAMVRSGAGFRFSPRELPMQWTTTVPVWPKSTTHDVPPRLQEAINQLIAEYGPPTRGRLRYLDRQIR